MDKIWRVYVGHHGDPNQTLVAALSYNPIERIEALQDTIDCLLEKIRKVTEAITEEVEFEE